MSLGDGEAGKQNRWYRAARRLPLPSPFGRLCGFHLRGGESVVGNHDGGVNVRCDDEHARRLGRIRGACMLLQPLVEGRLTAREIVELVLSRERLRTPIRHWLLENARLREELGQSRILLWRAVEQLHEPHPLLVLENKTTAVTEHPVCLHNRCLDNEVRESAIGNVSGSTDEVVRVRSYSEVPSIGRSRRLAHETNVR